MQRTDGDVSQSIGTYSLYYVKTVQGTPTPKVVGNPARHTSWSRHLLQAFRENALQRPQRAIRRANGPQEGSWGA